MSCLIDSEGLVILVSSTLCASSSARFLELCGEGLDETSNLDSLGIMAGCGSLHMFSSAATGSRLDDEWIRH